METIDSSKQYSLRWEKHAFNLAAEAGYFFEDESFLDCTLSAEGQCIEAHKIILSASSSYLSSLLKITPDKHPILIFNDMKFEQLKSLVSFIYNGSVNVSENNIHEFLNAAQSLLIKGLSEDEPQDGSKTSENIRKIQAQDPKFSNRRNFTKAAPLIRKPEPNHDVIKNPKRQRPLLPKADGAPYVECEESLSKLQEISFTKYINQNLGARQPGRIEAEKQWNGPIEDKSKVPENYIVKSWRHNSVDDLNGRHKPGKNNLFKKFKLEKPTISRDDQNQTEIKNKVPPEKADSSGSSDNPKSDDDTDDKIKKEPEMEQIVLVEPKQEFMEEDDTNSDQYDDGHTQGSESLTSEPESVYDGRPVPYFQHPIVDRGVPVPLLMCKTSLSEPDSSEPGWMPPIPSAIIPDHQPQLAPLDNSQDLQCRTCSQDLPCPTCTKKYKSRYALNRHILYECGKARKSFSCDECGKKVTRQDTLQKHKLIHLVQHLKEKESEAEKSPEAAKMKKKC